jgi:hypothetical protein
MGLFRKKQRETKSEREEVEVTLVTGSESLDVVGESFRQDALWTIVGGAATEHVRQGVTAILIPETDNPYDPNAISVWVIGLQVGFLSREEAARYRPGLVALWQKYGRPVALQGQIIGGGRRADGSTGSLGVFLSHDPADFGLEPRSDSTGSHVRTGRHDASSSCVGLENLPGDDVGAIKAVRRLLEQEQEPIARHFAYAELEHRLYHCRDVFASALGEFDATCEAHHNEMTAIRPALVAEFGGIPLLELYRQISIRNQKAREWESVIAWATRGIAIYGDEALDQEYVNDLKQRETNATAKLHPALRVAPPSHATNHDEPQIEELICRRCANTFTREVTRGRKPTLCWSCKELKL